MQMIHDHHFISFKCSIISCNQPPPHIISPTWPVWKSHCQYVSQVPSKPQHQLLVEEGQCRLWRHCQADRVGDMSTNLDFWYLKGHLWIYILSNKKCNYIYTSGVNYTYSLIHPTLKLSRLLVILHFCFVMLNFLLSIDSHTCPLPNLY